MQFHKHVYAKTKTNELVTKYIKGSGGEGKGVKANSSHGSNCGILLTFSTLLRYSL